MSYQTRYLRMNGTRAEQLARLRSQGWQVVTFKHAPLVVAWHALAGQFHAKGWEGNAAQKPAWYYSFPTLARLETYAKYRAEKLAVAANTRAERNQERAARRAQLKASDHYAVGDVLYNSWGYDQTNVDWYQVTEVKPRSIVIRPIGKNYAETASLAGISQPIRYEFKGEAITKPLREDGGISAQYGCFTKWNGKPVGESHYA